MGYVIENSNNYDLRRQMWQHNVKPFVYRLSIVDAFESLPKKIPESIMGMKRKIFGESYTITPQVRNLLSVFKINGVMTTDLLH